MRKFTIATAVVPLIALTACGSSFKATDKILPHIDTKRELRLDQASASYTASVNPLAGQTVGWNSLAVAAPTVQVQMPRAVVPGAIQQIDTAMPGYQGYAYPQQGGYYPTVPAYAYPSPTASLSGYASVAGEMVRTPVVETTYQPYFGETKPYMSALPYPMPQAQTANSELLDVPTLPAVAAQ